MPADFSDAELRALPSVFSVPRFATYLTATAGNQRKALALYRWNLQVSSAFLVPLQVCEVAVRNAVVDGLEAVHTPNWPWANGFRRSLPSNHRGYSPKDDLIKVSTRMPTSGKVVSELKFVFWEKMFNVRHEKRLWDHHFHRLFPGSPPGTSVSNGRTFLGSEISKIRDLRNRIAHHEPIFVRPFADEYDRIHAIISWRCPATASWVDRIQKVKGLLKEKP